MESRLLTQRTGLGGQVAALFLFLVAAALSVVLLRPVCEVLFAHTGVAQDPAACCASVVDGAALDLADLAMPGPGGKPLLGGVADLLGASFSPRPAATRFASLVQPARSYYARSSRIQR
jgi:hypothetical protein